MRRREFIAGLGSATAWPLAVRAQQPSTPVVGFLNAAVPGNYARQVAAFLKGLGEGGFVDGRNVAVEYRWAEDQNSRLPALAADLVKRQVAVIAATSTPAALAAKAATSTTPIVFEMAADPVQLGLVASLNRPGGNVTGVTQINVEVGAKRLELLHEIMPAAREIAFLVNPSNPAVAEASTNQMQTAAQTLGIKLHVLHASAESDFGAAFARARDLGAGGIVMSAGDPLFASRTGQLGALAERYGVPAVGARREFVSAGGLASYGSSIDDAYRLAGSYTARVLRGDKPADLPVQQATRVELFINLKAARALGITFPQTLLARADDVIE
jgi:putative tryptophan/tyrosine transport system substrate-binding protein